MRYIGYGYHHEGRFGCGCHEHRGYRRPDAKQLIERLRSEKEKLETELSKVSELLERLERE